MALAIVGYCCLALMGLTLSLFGAGGSILAIPILFYLINIPMVTATTYALLIVGACAFFLSIRYQSSLPYKKILPFALPSLLTTFIARHFILPVLTKVMGIKILTQCLTLLLAALMIASAFYMIKGRNFRKNADHQKSTISFGVISCGLLLGFLTGILGAGGGFLIIPCLVILMGFEMHETVLASLFIITVNAAVGFAADRSHFSLQEWLYLLFYTGLTLIGMFIGSQLRAKINATKLRKIFGWFLIAVALPMVLEAFVF